ncbi:MAG: hypothetical protein HN842_02735 [Gammaproteobacteria bacterium]|nr:hypothetical protein [Gammaproteobacteria bacterium]
MKHTPAPWITDTGTDGAVIYKLDEATIATVPMDLLCHEANARLIAAAPELLEALEHLVKITYDYGDTRDRNSPVHDALKQASDAITKATLSTVTN